MFSERPTEQIQYPFILVFFYELMKMAILDQSKFLNQPVALIWSSSCPQKQTYCSKTRRRKELNDCFVGLAIFREATRCSSGTMQAERGIEHAQSQSSPTSQGTAHHRIGRTRPQAGMAHVCTDTVSGVSCRTRYFYCLSDRIYDWAEINCFSLKCCISSCGLNVPP